MPKTTKKMMMIKKAPRPEICAMLCSADRVRVEDVLEMGRVSVAAWKGDGRSMPRDVLYCRMTM